MYYPAASSPDGLWQLLVLPPLASPPVLSPNGGASVRWTPAYAGVEGNEHADITTKRAAEGREGRADPEHLGEASLSSCGENDGGLIEGDEGVDPRPRQERASIPIPLGGKLCKELGKVRKELASRFYQLLSGYAVTGKHMVIIIIVIVHLCMQPEGYGAAIYIFWASGPYRTFASPVSSRGVARPSSFVA